MIFISSAVYRPETAVNFRKGLDSVTWDETTMNDLQRFANESEQFAYCGNLQVHVIKNYSATNFHILMYCFLLGQRGSKIVQIS